MSAIGDLLSRLTDAAPEEREAIWSSIDSPMLEDDVRAELTVQYPALDWVLLRLDAGLPGQALPDAHEAREQVLLGKGGPAEAYAAIFSGEPVEREDLCLPLIVNAAACCLQGGFGWLAAWLAGRAAVACLVLGEPERAWRYLDLPRFEGELHPHLRLMELFMPLKGHAELEASGWTRAALWMFWFSLGVPAIPQLPFPERKSEDGLESYLQRLQAVGAKDFGGLVRAFVESMEQHHQEVHPQEPLLKELRRRALIDEPPPELDEVPDWLMDAAQDLLLRGEHETARLAGLLLASREAGEPRLCAMLVWPVARFSDIPVLHTAFCDTDLGPQLEDLQRVGERIPGYLADALVAVCLPRHERSTVALQVLERDLEVLLALSPLPGGLVEAGIEMVLRIHEDRAREHAEVRPFAGKLRASVERAVARLGEVGSIAPSDVERAAASVVLPPLSLPLLELSQEAGLPAMERLVQALALLPAVEGTNLHEAWGPGLRHDASQALWRLADVRLFPLRIALLDKLIEDPGPIFSPAELYFQRANTRRALAGDDTEEIGIAIRDLEAAASWALRRGEVEFLADAVASMGKAAAELGAITQGRDGTARSAELLGRIREVLELPVSPQRRAMLLQAQAHLQRSDDVGLAADLSGEAADCLELDDPFRWEVMAEQVSQLVTAGRLGEAVSIGHQLLDEVTEQASDTVLGMVHVAVGEALQASGNHVGARRQLEAAIERVRGVDVRNERAARIRLGRLGVATGDQSLFEQQYRSLVRRWQELSGIERSDVARLGAQAVERGMLEARAVRSQMEEVFGEAGHWTPDPLDRLMMVRLARLAGEDVPLDAPLLQALEGDTEPDVRATIGELACNYGGILARTTLEKLLERARDRYGLDEERLTSTRRLEGPRAPAAIALMTPP